MATVNWRTQKIKIKIMQQNLFDTPLSKVIIPKAKKTIDLKEKSTLTLSASSR